MTPLLAILLLTHSNAVFTASSPHFWVLIALGFGLAGEWILKLTLSSSSWLFGLHSIGYLCYSKAIWLQLNNGVSWWLPIVVIAVAVIVVLLLLPILDKVLLPVIIMGIMLLQLLSVSTQVWLSEPSNQHAFAVIGSVLFIGAGLFIAVFSAQRFQRFTWHARVAILLYSSAQLAMVLSVV
jgi:uncharacterized membrane protein YhhN